MELPVVLRNKTQTRVFLKCIYQNANDLKRINQHNINELKISKSYSALQIQFAGR